jgi:alkyl sulfatase BDS1-like metallo-beta-lactamase superfamily hydrolase
MLDKYHDWINSMQFSSLVKKSGVNAHDFLAPTITIKEKYQFTLGQYTFELYHDKGETDDSIWLWIPEIKALFTGDLAQISYPNVGNPYKVQRYPKHWAIALERMLEKKPEYLVLGHGKPIFEKNQINNLLSITAEAMYFVHDEVVKRLNQGKWFEEIFHEMLDIYPERFKNSPYLKPIYGCYRFAIHATYRLYHGWYDTGNPTDLFPSKKADIAKELIRINNPESYLEHAKRLYNEEKYQLALHLLDIIIIAGENTSKKNTLIDTFQLKQKILKLKASKETSLIAVNILNNGVTQIKKALKKMKKRSD